MPTLGHKYRVTFVMNDVRHVVWIARWLNDFKDGFWVDKDYQMTKGSDACYYILPHMIKQILKVPLDEQKKD